jgi:CubicO group peptidase (beta-lactamase class C family)
MHAVVRRTSKWFCVAVALAAPACSGDRSHGRDPRALDFSAFDAAVSAFVAAHGLKGAVAVVFDERLGVLHHSGYGAHTVDRISLIASSSKIVSSGVLMQLADEGRIDIDAPISTYLTGWGEHKADITVAHLLSNSAGLVGLRDNPTYPPYICQYIAAGSLSDCTRAIYTADDAADRVPPDTAFRYGGGGWQLAGGIAERVGGQSWAELVRRTYARCSVASLAYTNQFTRAFATGGVNAARSYPTFFDGDPATLPSTDNPNIEGGASITAGDYAKILLMHLRGGVCDGGRVLSGAAVQRMQEDRIAPYGGETFIPELATGYGLGWWVSRTEPGLVLDPGVYGAVPWLDRERGYGAFLLIESSSEVGTQLYLTTKPMLDQMFDRVPDH